MTVKCELTISFDLEIKCIHKDLLTKDEISYSINFLKRPLPVISTMVELTHFTGYKAHYIVGWKRGWGSEVAKFSPCKTQTELSRSR